MKNGALIFNIVLSIAVIVLFYLHFSGGKKTVKPSGNSQTTVTTPSDAKILYVNSDSVNANYKFFSDLQSKFESDNKIREEKLRSRQGSLQSMLKNYENNVATMTTRERQKEEEKIGAYQQQLQQDAQEFQMLAAQQESEMINQIYDTLYVFFNEYAKEKNVDMIFTFQKGGQIMYINPALDVTGDVVLRLNERHAKNTPKTETIVPTEGNK